MRIDPVIAAVILGLTGASVVRGQVVDVPGTANIFGAGHSVPPEPGGLGGGTLPPVVSFTPGTGLILTVPNVSGTVTLTPGFPNNGNGSSGFPTNITSFGGISGIIHTNRSGFLTGVFIDNNEPVDPAPARLTFTAPVDYTTLAPVLGQTFFIGDGRTETGGMLHRILVPQSATRLYLGFADANGYAGPPGAYVDNSGSLQVTVNITGVPEPGSMAMLGTAAGGWAFLRRRKAVNRH
jgi:PEP-CTERM motif